MTAKLVPTLSSTGWVADTASKADFLISHFFTSIADQTFFFPGEVSSIQDVVEKSDNNAINLATNLRVVLNKYLGRYFDAVDLTVSVTDTDNKLNIRFTATVTDQGKDYSFGRLVEASGTKITKIANLNS